MSQRSRLIQLSSVTAFALMTFVGIVSNTEIALAQNHNEDGGGSKLGTAFGGKGSSSLTEPGETQPDKQGIRQGGSSASSSSADSAAQKNAPSVTASPSASFPEASTAHTTTDDQKH